MIKKTVLCIIAFVLAAGMLMSCQAGGQAADVSVDEIRSKVTDVADVPSMTSVDSDNESARELFAYLSDTDYEKVDSFFMMYSSEGLADEIAVVKMKDASDADEMTASLENHVDGRVTLYRNYDPSQTERAEDALVFSSGRYCVLIICDNADEVKQAVTACINGQE